jgi:hypothetical protein
MPNQTHRAPPRYKIPGFFSILLDNDWMRVRAEAKRQGAVLTYHRIADQDSRKNDQNIMLLTEFKNAAAYDAREKLFSSIRKQLPDNASAVIPQTIGSV